MKYLYFFIFILLGSCSNNTAVDNKTPGDTTVVITTDTVPETRKVVSKKPVASYLVPVNDPKLQRTFGVEVYETSNTFDYIMKMHYEAIQETDTLRIPNFGIWPEIKIIKGAEKVSCVIGFFDKQKVFRPYKMVSAKGDHMRLIELKKYFTGRYRTQK